MNDQTSPDLAAERAALHARIEGAVAAEAAFNVPEVLTYWAEDGIVQPAGSPQIEGKDATEAARYDMGARIRAVIEGPEGALYILEDGDGGRLRRLTPAE